ncbi:hypothetical protein [Deinococcus pimensis]|uniref:hypothetical protein n=1 Tax=Deinococcus pimensis TaxID=309888 RepID=UPI0004B5CF24|nr:hypothetical protein [Deinococcus pimensis]
MTRALLLLSFLTTGAASAASQPIKGLLTGDRAVRSFSQPLPNLLSFQYQTSDGTTLAMGMLVGNAGTGGRVTDLSILALREYLTPAERRVLRDVVVRVALKCFNIRAERQNAMSAWLDAMNAGTFRDKTSTFGPLRLTFQRYISDNGDFTTFVRINRTGTPGQTPWINYCTH